MNQSQRSDKPVFDGVVDNFQLTLKDKASRAEVGDLFWVDVDVTNPDNYAAGMFVQCSILNRDEHDWIVGLESVTKLTTDENCVENEPFTQTARVELSALGWEEIQFAFIVPDSVDGDNVLFCEAYEQCYGENIISFVSSDIINSVIILPNDNDPRNNNFYTGGQECVVDDDCSTWFINLQECAEGYCIDKYDLKGSDFSLSDSSIGAWFEDNQILAIGGGVLIIIIGIMFIFKEPKQRRYTF